MKRNRMTICGRKTSTPPTPAMTPSTTRLRSGPGGIGRRDHVADPLLRRLRCSSISGVGQV